LATKQSSSTISNTKTALRQFGAFRLVAPQLTGHLSQRVFQDARRFFQLPIAVKNETRGYSAFGTELIRGKTVIPKEGVYFRKGVEDYHPPPSEFQYSVKDLHHVSRLLAL
jgi:isopenicillin N synthase-like dioxygenase